MKEENPYQLTYLKEYSYKISKNKAKQKIGTKHKKFRILTKIRKQHILQIHTLTQVGTKIHLSNIKRPTIVTGSSSGQSPMPSTSKT